MNIACVGTTSNGTYSDPDLYSLIFAHEGSHGLFGFDDEYGANGGFCGHSLMNGPANWTYSYCKPINHCYDGKPGATGGDCGATASNWYKLTYSSYGGLFHSLPNLARDHHGSRPRRRLGRHRAGDALTLGSLVLDVGKSDWKACPGDQSAVSTCWIATQPPTSP